MVSHTLCTTFNTTTIILSLLSFLTLALSHLQLVQNAAAGDLKDGSSFCCFGISSLAFYKFRIYFKILIYIHKAFSGLAPQYINRPSPLILLYQNTKIFKPMSFICPPWLYYGSGGFFVVSPKFRNKVK